MTTQPPLRLRPIALEILLDVLLAARDHAWGEPSYLQTKLTHAMDNVDGFDQQRDEVPMEHFTKYSNDDRQIIICAEKMLRWVRGGACKDTAQKAREEGITLIQQRLLDIRNSNRPKEPTVIKPISYAGQNLVDADFSYIDFTGTDFSGANVSGANFEGSDLTDADFEGARCHGTRFKNAVLRGADFDKAHLEVANFAGATLEKAGFYKANLKGASLVDADVNAAFFLNADLDSANLSGAYGNDADFEGARCHGTRFKNAVLRGADFRDTDLTDTNLLGTQLEDTRGDNPTIIRVLEEQAAAQRAACLSEGAAITEETYAMLTRAMVALRELFPSVKDAPTNEVIDTALAFVRSMNIAKEEAESKGGYYLGRGTMTIYPLDPKEDPAEAQAELPDNGGRRLSPKQGRRVVTDDSAFTFDRRAGTPRTNMLGRRQSPAVDRRQKRRDNTETWETVTKYSPGKREEIRVRQTQEEGRGSPYAEDRKEANTDAQWRAFKEGDSIYATAEKKLEIMVEDLVAKHLAKVLTKQAIEKALKNEETT